ncbi:protein ENHANCED DISEASE RESISTANCE 2 isoform X1 [Cinnamomum micranthum f. kanehirae]|uniref:Protein ENHANCED DISEASE RESISTANCE 2 isoform X1 n=1 Tax=Cinnamomum micranthum f. kanehirae TaxID=337451 RepID=A0A443PK06_9MAGN|nr:protein ENHANCED DISEASE RESISTANCE 2 isoform X1 [Cinnamomum micranthum f. kanehirae]
MSSKTAGSEASEREGSEGGSDERSFEYFGWVYHVGVNSIGHEYCHLRYLLLKGNKVEMYKRDPQENPGIKPIRSGVVGHTLMVEEQGRRKVNNGDLYVLRFYNRLDEKKKGEAEYVLSRKSNRRKLSIESDSELNLEGHRPRVRRGLRKLVRIGKAGPEMLLSQSSALGSNEGKPGRHLEGDFMDAVEAHEWKCVDTVNGIRIFEDVASSQNDDSFLVKSVGVIDANLDRVFEVVCSVDRHKRYEWDVLTGDLELIDSVNGHYDVIYGTYDTKYLSQWHSKRDFVFSRQWFRGQDGSYTILQFPAVHKKKPPRPGYRRIKINPSIWEIRRLNPSLTSSADKCLVTHMMEIHSSGWGRWKKRYFSKFEKTIPYVLLCQVAGLREFFQANPALTSDSPTTILHSKMSSSSSSFVDFEDSEVGDQFYDAIAAEPSEDEDSDDDEEQSLDGKVKLKNVSWAIASLALKRSSALAASSELDAHSTPIQLDASQFHGSMHKGKDESDTNCWTSPSGQGFMIRGKMYLKDYAKVIGGDPLLKLLAVDWFTADNNIDGVALDPKCLVQSEAAKKLPFILVINLQVPAKPNYSLILYYGADKPINKGSLLSRFVDGTDIYRDARFKLIPSIVEGYWMVKRAVGSKACLLGKAVTCKYLRQDNFLEIDVDIGSSSVARSIINLAKEENELPEFILGTVRLNRVKKTGEVFFFSFLPPSFSYPLGDRLVWNKRYLPSGKKSGMFNTSCLGT